MVVYLDGSLNVNEMIGLDWHYITVQLYVK